MGIPETLVTDNGSQFTSEVFQSFMKGNGRRHINGAPYHPATNGLAEPSVVRNYRSGRKCMNTGRDCCTNRACVIPSPCKRDSLETACRSDDPGFKVEAECEETTNATPNENSVSRPPDDLQDEVAITKF
ncbi:uncharacterized protein LOC134183568 [Corticium candelabrum]|uniref:uncharacterized protein LOC134183568 n=1 Tax=Corticium candelabrum TaxID=121492 RepID=UPI002E25F631|nr:uncharacterized protein LOC134183568 [Corticium candelabrum]